MKFTIYQESRVGKRPNNQDRIAYCYSRDALLMPRPIIPLHVPGQADPGPLRFDSPPPLALYIHVPWCVRKCPYCDFNSHGLERPAGGDARLGEVPEQAYVAALMSST